MRLLAFLFVLVFAAPALAEVPTQLPRGVDPLAYELTLTPDAKALTFQGQVTVNFQAAVAADRIVLNAAGLKIARATLDGAPVTVALDGEAETATFTPARSVAPGRHALAIEYTGRINDRPAGLFHLDHSGGRLLATQFEPSDARRLLPLFDEPAKKATFTVTAVVPAAELAISNMPEASSTPLAGGLKRVRFQPTPKMSSYLLFFGLGDMERLSAQVDGTTISVVMRRGDAEKGRYALEAAKQVLAYYNDWFGVKYPLPKLDLIGAPGEVGGSMENWGAILFSQYHLIVDPKLSTASDRQQVYSVVAHEIAHMWFGDLVTMAWWDDLWLNEGFANWMSTNAMERFHPEWHATLATLSEKEDALRLDSRSSTHPVVQKIGSVAEAEQAFDDITYKKGEAVIRMLEAYAGPDAWKAGVRAYMRAHLYGNATNEDLWRFIDRAAGKSISGIARDFTLKPGVPLISVAQTRSGLELTQERFGVDEASRSHQTWRVPVRLAKGSPLIVSNRAPTRVQTLPPYIVNHGQLGYFRTLYDAEVLAPLETGLARLEPADQFGLLADSFALGMAGYGPVPTYLRLVTRLPASAEPLVWQSQAGTLASLGDYYDPGPRRDAYRAWARSVLGPVLARLGFDARRGEADNDAVLRQTLILALSQMDDPAVIAEARRRVQAAGGDVARLSGDDRRWVQATLARGATPAEFDALLALARRTKDPLEAQRIFGDLAEVRDDALAARFLAFVITDEVPAAQTGRLVRAVANVHPELAWRFTLDHLAEISRGSDALARTTIVPRIAAVSSDARRADELEAYAAKNIPPDAQGEVRVAVSRIRSRAELKQKRLPEVDAWIAGQR